jgi:alkaline phosphatase D
VLWKEIKKNNPNIWVWGGDNIYSDSENMDEIKEDYEKLKNQKGYLNLTRDIPVLAT